MLSGGCKMEVTTMTLSPDKTVLAAGYGDGSIRSTTPTSRPSLTVARALRTFNIDTGAVLTRHLRLPGSKDEGHFVLLLRFPQSVGTLTANFKRVQFCAARSTPLNGSSGL